MKYTIQNETLLAEVKTGGGELCRLLHKPTGEELLWNADPAVWAGYAPIMFPHCGAVVDDVIDAKGQKGNSPRHGFARHSEFALVGQSDASLRLRLTDTAETRKIYPYAFRLDTVYTLDGDTLLHTLEMTNPAESGETLPFNVGYHPAFLTPGGGWVFRFEVPEHPVEIKTDEKGLVNGVLKQWGETGDIPVTDDLFANDSMCFTNLQSKSLSLVKTGTTRSVKVGIEGFPYTLIWGQPKGPHRYVCIEPWHGVPDPVKPYGDFAKKPGVTLLPPGETFSTTMPVHFTM